MPAAEKSHVLSGPVRLIMVNPCGIGLDELEVVPDSVLGEDSVATEGLSRLLRGIAFTGLQRLGHRPPSVPAKRTVRFIGWSRIGTSIWRPTPRTKSFSWSPSKTMVWTMRTEVWPL